MKSEMMRGEGGYNRQRQWEGRDRKWMGDQRQERWELADGMRERKRTDEGYVAISR